MVLEDARSQLLAALGDDGVQRIEYAVGFVDPYDVSVWLATATDAQRDALAQQDGLEEKVAETLRAAGIDESDAVFSNVIVQSQETVDREYDGSWFYALR